MRKVSRKEALDYHAQGRKGKIEVKPTKPYTSQRDLSLAYSPGVAEPCMAIADNKSKVFDYTAKGNLVAVISNGTAVLGLGNIGPEASKPVMEGKGLLFKIFADIDVFDIEVDATNIDEFVKTVKNIAPTFGGINLEDIKAPEAFEIERRLKEELEMPVMHDDQHGTAIISCAALLNALELSNKKIEDISIVVSGAGAAAISCCKLYLALGAKRENIIMCDSKGVIKPSRGNLDQYKSLFANEVEPNTLAEAMVGSDVFVGLSKGDIVDKEMVASMAKDCIVFALANPTPEIGYKQAISVRDDIIMATGRSDHPNQVNNVIGFPFIFRGALDVQATAINEAMKLAAVKAIANLAKESVPEEVNLAYNERNLSFGRDFIIPKPLDHRLLTCVAPAVAKAAIESGVAKKTIEDWDAYKEELEHRLGLDNKLMSSLVERAKKDPKKVVFAEADNYKVLRAAQTVKDEGIAEPILLGPKAKLEALIEKYELELDGVPIIDPRSEGEMPNREKYGHILYNQRKRKGYTLPEAIKAMRERNYYGCVMLKQGDADALISGISRNYPDTLRPALQIIGRNPKNKTIAGMYLLNTKKGPLFLADTTINLHPTARQLADITTLTAEAVSLFNIKPKIALLSYSNFGSSKGDEIDVIKEAVSILHRERPDVIADGEIQANFALDIAKRKELFPFSLLAKHRVNTLIFPNLSSGNIAYKFIQEMSDIETIGPVLLGMKKPVHVLQLGSSVREIVNMVTLAVVDAQMKKRNINMLSDIDEKLDTLI
ncbi:MAG: NADP-dependent malic enzyme [Crocinitomicaceae bacterium]|nr:NADP-dependent malic enzyme [Crocinitomicaceae bacterium]|tara:strand:- start:35348 stop:37666 length:2319 start_codon:yes stop_codon:yes gene_type:complete